MLVFGVSSVESLGEAVAIAPPGGKLVEDPMAGFFFVCFILFFFWVFFVICWRVWVDLNTGY